MDDLKNALEAQQAAEAALKTAKRTTREIAMRNLQEAQAACRAVGIELLVRVDKRSDRKRNSARMKAAWAGKSPEERAAWLAKMAHGRVAVNGGLTQ